jgi:hypothetical protein
MNCSIRRRRRDEVWYYGIMAVRKMTFSIPADLAAMFIRRVPARERSRYLAEALAERLEERDRKLIAACEIANRDSEVASIEREFDLLNDPLVEPWTVPTKRHQDAKKR